jgi:hypothetical protein
MESTGMLDNTRRLVEAARSAGATIVHAPITFAPGYGELSEHPYGILKGVVDSTAFVKGEWGAEIIDALAPQQGDVVVEGKRGLGTFATTNLDFGLRGRDLPRGARERDQVRLSDVLRGDVRGGVHGAARGRDGGALTPDPRRVVDESTTRGESSTQEDLVGTTQEV